MNKCAYTLVSAPQRGEYANETNFITMNNWREEVQVRAEPSSVKRLAIFTDGIQSMELDSAYDNKPYAPFFDPLFAWAEKQEDEQADDEMLADFLVSPKVTARTNDDITLALATLSSAATFLKR